MRKLQERWAGRLRAMLSVFMAFALCAQGSPVSVLAQEGNMETPGQNGAVQQNETNNSGNEVAKGNGQTDGNKDEAAKSLIDLSLVHLVVVDPKVEYTGEALTPKVVAVQMPKGDTDADPTVEALVLKAVDEAVRNVVEGEEPKLPEGARVLEEDAYTLEFENNVEVGTAHVSAKGVEGLSQGEASADFEIVAPQNEEEAIGSNTEGETPGNAEVQNTDGKNETDKVPDGEGKQGDSGTLTLGVSNDGGKKLSAQSDTEQKTKDISKAEVSGISNVTYTGKAQTQKLVVRLNNVTLAENKDYQVKYANNVNAGTATITIEAKGEYTGKTTRTFSIARKNVSSVSLSTVKQVAFTGGKQMPNVSVYDGKVALRNNVDYKVSYTNNVNAGTATATITGVGNYTGTKSVAFSITKPVNKLTITWPGKQKYTGGAIQPIVVVCDGGRALRLNKDYKVSYSNNVNVGTAKVTVTGLGVYTGSTTNQFSIEDLVSSVIAKARTQLGVRYYSMHTGPRGCGDEGFGCAMFYAWCLNQVLGTNYYGSCWDFWGDALGSGSYNQGGGEFYQVSNPMPGDAVCYIESDTSGGNPWNCTHMALYIGNGRVIGSCGVGTPGSYGYINNGGVCETSIGAQAYGRYVRYIRSRRIAAGAFDRTAQVPGNAANNDGLVYRAHVQKFAWCDYVHDGQVAGTTGRALRGESLEIVAPEGVKLDGMAHIQTFGDQKAKVSSDGSVLVVGTTGLAKRMEGINIRVVSNNNPALKNKTLMYRVHIQKIGWSSWVKAGTFCGTRGRALRAEAVQMKFV